MRMIIGGIIVFLLFSPWLFAEVPKLKIADGEKFNGALTSEKGEREKVQIRFYAAEEEGKTIYSYVYIRPKVKWHVSTDVRAYPIKIIYEEEGNRVELNFSGEGGVEMKGLWNGKKINKTGKFSNNVTLETFLVARTLNFNSTEKYVVDLLSDDKFPDLEHYKMFFRVIGDEVITVKAGTFHCKKVLFTPDSTFKSLFYKGYFYITNDEHRYIIKTENVPSGFNYEAESIENSPL